MRKIKAAAPLQRTRPREPVPNGIIPETGGSVKPERANELRALRLSKNLPAKAMVQVVRGIYPKYDKTIQSKCERGEVYGIRLREDAMDALIARFAPETVKRTVTDHHKRTCRISCRLEDSVYAALQLQIRRDGYKNTQSWLEQQVIAYLQDRSEQVKGDSHDQAAQ